MGGELPEWAARQLLAEALRACGLPWVPWAWWRRPADRWMSPADIEHAIALEGLVVAAARLRLPAGVGGRAVDRAWRDAAWRCIVAGLALLDVESRARLAARRDESTLLVVKAEPPAMPRRPAAEAPATFTIRRRGEVQCAT